MHARHSHLVSKSVLLFTFSERKRGALQFRCSLACQADNKINWSSTTYQVSLKCFFFLIFEDISPFRGATDTPVLDFWWCLPWVSKPGWIPSMLFHLCDPLIHLWCDTCWLHRGQHGSWAFLIHILTDLSTSIDGGSGQTGAWTHNCPCRTQQAWHCKPLGHSGSARLKCWLLLC